MEITCSVIVGEGDQKLTSCVLLLVLGAYAWILNLKVRTAVSVSYDVYKSQTAEHVADHLLKRLKRTFAWVTLWVQ
jgi:hypothetical protein